MTTEKVEYEKVNTLLISLESITSGIIEIARNGDDGYMGSIDEMFIYWKAAVKNFKLQVALCNIKEEKTSPDYLSNKYRPATGYNESRVMYQRALYSYFKKSIKESKTDISTMNTKDLQDYIEGDLLANSDYAKAAYGKEWMYTTMKVIEDIIQEILDHRRDNPQQTLFT